jgi:hypothetical protein
MTTEHKLLLATLITKSRRKAAYLKDEIALLEGMGLIEEALAKSRARRIHVLRCVRFNNRLIQQA